MLMNTPLCDFGAPAPDFRLSDPSGAEVSLDDIVTDKGAVVMFICNHCPYVVAVAERLARDAKTLQDEGIGVVAIMSNDFQSHPADAPARMAEFANTHGFSFAYLIDEDQSVGRAYGAQCTPDFFGYNGKRELQYRGRLDDARMGDAQGRTPELVNAMRQIAETGRGPAQQQPSMGCSIKWKA